MSYTSERSRTKRTRELNFNSRQHGTIPQKYIVKKINRIIIELNHPKALKSDGTKNTNNLSRIELVGNLQEKSIRFIESTYGITPHSSLPLGHGYTRCFFWIRKNTPLANLDEIE